MKKKVFFLRGLIREGRHWEFFKKHFESRFPEVDTYFFDILGTGQKIHIDSPLSIAGYIEDLREEFLQEKVDFNVFLPISLGGMIAFNWLSSYPTDFDKTYIINSSLGDYSPFYKRFRLKNLPLIAKVALSRSLEYSEKSMIDIVVNREERREEIVRSWVQIQEDAPMSFLNKLRQLVAGARFKAKIDPNFFPKQRVKIIVGQGDRLVSPECSHVLSKKLDLDISSHPTAGHALPVDEPEWLLDQISESLT